MVPPDALDYEANWDAVLFVRSRHRDFLWDTQPRALGKLAAEILEGQRTEPDTVAECENPSCGSGE